MKHHNFSLKLAGFLGLALLAITQGCSDDSDNDKPDPTIPIDTAGKSSGGKASGGTKADAGDDGGGEDGGKGAVSNGGTGNTGATNNDAGTGNDAGSGPVEPPECTLPERGANDCYNCPQNGETVQWLNRCVSGSKCVEFDNEARVPLAATVEIDASLPALP